ncbi:P1 family peptidase [Caldisericum exile]|uniref:Hydrolase n=1 Tax=Caldisericum exile (strain DSM 21853 / NBRC 104410 / AZM16c01) TaxID=511051 RepID=A0A7U6JER5_CALEA|nr:P1 family peptidase [Caldisericum exile]BAL80748.1 putative hydrolase [Caldisericum exile AZM16c01]
MGSITDVKGILVGNYEDFENLTGATAIVIEKGASASVDVRGGAPGTRETDLLNPENLVEYVNAIYIGGGSAMGLEGASGVSRYLEEKNIGFDTGVKKVPIVSGAIIFDLSVGTPIYPDIQAGYIAAKSSTDNFNSNGNVGAGVGATVGKIRGMDFAMKGGLGTDSIKVGDIVVGALVVVNALGDIYDFDNKIIAGALNDSKNGFINTEEFILKTQTNEVPFKNTTIGVVATNVKLTKAKLKRLAIISHDAIARRIRPSHTIFDGDTVFTLSTNEFDFDDLLTLGVLFENVLERAIINAIKHAKSLKNIIAFNDLKV